MSEPQSIRLVRRNAAASHSGKSCPEMQRRGAGRSLRFAAFRKSLMSGCAASVNMMPNSTEKYVEESLVTPGIETFANADGNADCSPDGEHDDLLFFRGLIYAAMFSAPIWGLLMMVVVG